MFCLYNIHLFEHIVFLSELEKVCFSAEAKTYFLNRIRLLIKETTQLRFARNNNQDKIHNKFIKIQHANQEEQRIIPSYKVTVKLRRSTNMIFI